MGMQHPTTTILENRLAAFELLLKSRTVHEMANRLPGVVYKCRAPHRPRLI